MENAVLNQIKYLFEEKGIRYYSDDSERIGAKFSDFVLMFHVTEEALSFKMYLEEKASAQCRPDVLEYLNYANQIMKEGHFILDNEGDIYFIIYTERSTDSYISDGRIMDILTKGYSANEMFHEELKTVIAGTATPLDAIRNTISNR
ncbi:MAG: YbjN domain-containing protein [Lachnospiraceae bacterium]|nr:YbjN domain-containing protein [Lachnospiraceae bacterium]MBP3609680.1 YbjN domain-containing protein [Lachnospiraceae bacterium]